MAGKVEIAGLKIAADAWELDLGDIKRKLTTLPDLSALPKLKWIEIRGHDLASLDGIEGAKKIWRVAIESRVKNLSALANLPKLEVLDLTGASRRSFADVPAMPRLKSLIANGVGLRTLAGIERFRGLKILNIDDNSIEKFEALAKLPKLTYVSCQQNLLRDLRGLPRTMTELHAHDNRISSLAGIEKLPKLEVLHLAFNALTKLPRLALPRLKVLGLSYNDIARLENLEGLRALRMLDVESSPVVSVSPATAAWLRSRKSTFQFHHTPTQLRSKPERFLAKTTVV